MKKYSYLLILLLTSFYHSHSQNIEIEHWNSGLSLFAEDINNAFIDANDKIVTSSIHGIFVMEDSIHLDTIYYDPAFFYKNRVFKGAYNNYLFSLNEEDIISLHQNGNSYIYDIPFTPSFPPSNQRSVYLQIIQRQSGELIVQMNHYENYISMIDSNDVEYFASQAPIRTPGLVDSKGIFELQPNRYMIKMNSYPNEEVAILDLSDSTIMVFDGDTFTTGFTPIDYLTLNEDTLLVLTRKELNFIDIASFNIIGSIPLDSLDLDENQRRRLVKSPTTGNFALVDTKKLLVFSNGSYTTYTDTTGYNIDTLGPFGLIIKDLEFNSKGELYIFGTRGTVIKISESQLVQLESQSNLNGSVKPFPNPVNRGEFLIIDNELMQNEMVRIELMDTRGKASISPLTFKESKNLKVQIPEELIGGIYILKILTKDKSISKKIIIR